MNSINELDLASQLPQVLSSDININALAKAFTQELIQVNLSTELLLILANLDKLPEAIIDELAWQLHVDFYDVSMPRITKTQLIKQSIAWHRRKGTVKVVEEIVSAVYSTAKVVENWEYGGHPYKFKLIVKGEPIKDVETLAELRRAINSVKNVRSWLDDIEFQQETISSIYMAGAVSLHKEVVIGG